MKTLFLALVFVASSGFAEDKPKEMGMNPEKRQAMAEAHQKMADCLKSAETPFEDCQKTMMETCSKNMGKDCPMMKMGRGMGKGMGKGKGKHHHHDEHHED